MADETNNTCKAHSGIITRLDHMENNNKVQWKKIDRIQWGVVLTLMAIIGNLVVLVVK